jgi:hypothetical protein
LSDSRHPGRSNANRRPGAARHQLHTRRLGRLSGATAQRLLDGGDGPSPLPQLLAAASAPATAAELRGESDALAAFRSSVHSAPLPGDLNRRSPVRITTSIMIAKAIAAIALTAGTAGGIALATSSAPADPYARPTSESATVAAAAAPFPVVTTPAPAGAAPDDLDGRAGALASERPGTAGGAGGAGGAEVTVRTTPGAEAPRPTGLCRGASNVATDGHPGKAAESPALSDPTCAGNDTDTDSDSDSDSDEDAAGRPTGRPTAAPGNPEQRTGRPDGAEDEDTAAESGRTAGQKAARADDEARGQSGEHRQDG